MDSSCVRLMCLSANYTKLYIMTVESDLVTLSSHSMLLALTLPRENR